MSLSDKPPTKQDFDDIFLGEEKLEGKLHLELDRTVLPVARPVRKVPFAMKEPLKQELNRSVKTGIVIPGDVPTDWISSMVVIKKSNGKIRLFIDQDPASDL